MSFLHPWIMALGAVAAAIPVAVHFLTRPRPVRMPLSTIRFVREAIREQKARHRLRDFILLALRTVAILLVAMALARPQWGARPLVSDQEAGAAVRVVVVDVSQSMAATQGQLANIERARTAAADYLRYGRDLRANLILAGATPRSVFDGPSTNFGALGEALANCRALPERLNLNRTLEKAATMLAPTGPDDHRRRELVVVSDFQRSGWAAADLSALPADTRIQFVSVAPATPAENLAIVRAELRGRASQERGAQIEVEVGNYTPTTRRVNVEVAVGGATSHLAGVCPPGRRTTLADTIQIPQTGWQTGSVRLVGNEDALAADDVHPLVTDVRPKPRYVLLTREPKERRPSSSHFVECALVPDAALGARASAELVRLDPIVADRESLAPADLLALDHPGKLSEKTIMWIGDLMRRGRPVLYVTAEAADAVNLQRLVDAAGGRARMPVEFSPSQAASPRRDLFLASIERKRPPFNVFGDSAGDVTRNLRFAGGLSSRRTTAGLADDVLATYGDGSACLLLTSFGSSTLAVLNADLG
ncbi:MAG: BatA domain-containing protein, partial [Planctomycetia bacterium]|nr:BatA domain-containing protein [Planctomycetia bacterium]